MPDLRLEKKADDLEHMKSGANKKDLLALKNLVIWKFSLGALITGMRGEEQSGAGNLLSTLKRLGTGTSWNVVGTVFNQGSIFLVNIFIARILGKITFGEYAIIQSTLLSTSMIAQLSIGLCATRYLAEHRSCAKEKCGRILGFCLIITLISASIAALVIFLTSQWLAANVLKAPQLSLGLMIGSGFILFSAINGYQIGALVGLESYSAIAKGGIVNGCCIVVICSLFAWYWGLNGAVGGLVLCSLISCIIHRFFLKTAGSQQDIYINFKNIWDEHKILFNFALPGALSGFLSMPATWLGNILLIRQAGGYGQLALYYAAMNFRTIVLFLPQNINRVVCSILNYQKGIGSERSYRQAYWVNIALNVIIVLTGGSILFIFGHKLLALYGKSFSEAYPVLVILLVAALVEVIANGIYQVILTYERMWMSLFAIALPNYGTFVLLAYILSPNYGAIGLALAFLIGWSMGLMIFGLVVWRLGLNLGRQLK